MTSEPIFRNVYSNPNDGSASNDVEWNNFDDDLNEFHLPLNRMQLANFQEWGIAQGLEVKGNIGDSSLTIERGVAVDKQGQLISLVLPQSEDDEQLDNPVVLNLSSLTSDGDTSYFVTIEFSEYLERSDFDEPLYGRYEHRPEIRLQPTESFEDDGTSIILARVVINAEGQLGDLQTEGRRLVSKKVQQLLLRRPQLTQTEEGTQVTQEVAGSIAATENGLQIKVSQTDDDILFSAPEGNNFSRLEVRANNSIFSGPLTVNSQLQVDELQVNGAIASSSLTVTGNVGIGTANPSQKLEVNGAIAATALSVTDTVTANAFQGDGSALTGKVSTAGDTMTGPLTINSDLTVNGVIASSSLTVTGNANIGGNLKVSGNVGIGINNPIQQLHVYQETGNPRIRVETDHSTNAAELELAGGDAEWHLYTRGSDKDLHFWSNGDKVIFTQDGNVGIGTTNPQAKLHVNGDVSLPPSGVLKRGSETFPYDGKTFAPYALGWFNDSWQSFGPTAWFSGWGGIKLFTNDQPRLSISNNGNVRIAERLFVGKLKFSNQANVQWDEDSGEFCWDNSSRTDKENISTLEDEFSKVLQVEPKAYTRPGNPHVWEIGYIAEEFDELGLNKLVGYNKDGRPRAIHYDKVSMYLIEVVKKLQQQINSYEQRINQLEQNIVIDRGE